MPLHRPSRAASSLEGLVFDFRFALRRLRRDRTFTPTAVGTLALAIGLNVTALTVMETMLVRGLPQARRSDRLLYIGMRKASDLP
jgi:xanthine/uracil permease